MHELSHASGVPHARPAGLGVWPAGPRVLVIEPDAELAELLRLALRREGLLSVGVPDARSAGASAPGPLAVVVDTDAVSLRDAVQALQGADRPRPLVLLTGRREPTLSARGRCPVVGRLAKPFAIAEFRALVRRALAQAADT